jgi:hypothetical protein
MAYLNCNIPPIECYVRGEFLQNLEDGRGTYYPCLIFGFASIPGRVPLFHSMLEDGGIFFRLPISAFCQSPDVAITGNDEQEFLEEIMLWDSFSYYPSIIVFDVLQNKRVKYVSRTKKEYFGNYMFTIDWANEDKNMPPISFSEAPGQHKCGHFIKLDNGNFAIQPNNRLKFHEPSFCTKPEAIISRKIHSHIWSVENNWKWVFEDNENYNYNIEERK